MNPILIAGLLAAWLATACRSADEEGPVVSPVKPKPDQKKSTKADWLPISPEPLPPAEPPLRINFGDDLQAASLFHRLLEGKPSAEVLSLVMDQGCAVGSADRRGQRDRWIEPCEVRRFLLESHHKYPDLAREAIGAPVPWSLDDGDPATAFDETIRQSLAAAVAKIRNSPTLQGKDPFDLKYQEILAIGLFHFVQFPTEEALVGEATDTLQASLQDLSDIGLPEFRDYLLEHGGLGLAEFPEVSTERLNALEALRLKEGDTYTMINVVYGALEAAGLPVDFFRLRHGKEEEPPNARSDRSGVLERPHPGMGVSLPLLGCSLVFSPQSGTHHLFPSQSLAISSDRYLAFLIRDVADQLNWAGKGQAAAELYARSLAWAGGQADVYNNWGVAQHQAGKLKEAEVAFRESLRLESGSNLAYFNLGWLLAKQGRHEESVALADQGMRQIGSKPGFAALGLGVAREAIKKDPNDIKAKRLQAAILGRP
ncbi:MAG TPA: tetratricopeptide repeat protein [bacterium]|nr:tetratricopeptide repeat protein [bacterium]